MPINVIVPAVLSALHLLTLALGLGAVVWRNQALLRLEHGGRWEDVLRADTAWGIAAILWIATGLARVFKGGQTPVFYLHNGFFWIKMALFAIVFAIELIPMVALLRVRAARRRGLEPPELPIARLRRIGAVETALVILIVFAAAFMARAAWLF